MNHDPSCAGMCATMIHWTDSAFWNHRSVTLNLTYTPSRLITARLAAFDKLALKFLTG
jgi:hypothetical protein